MTPPDPWRTAAALWRLGVEAQTVIALRTMAMAGLLPKPAGEDRRMVEEKGRAFALAAMAAGAAMMRGGSPDAVVQAAIRPLARRTGANLRRLAPARKA